MRCSKRVIHAVRTEGGGIGVFRVRCHGGLVSGKCNHCGGVRGTVNRVGNFALLDRFLARVTLLEEAAQQIVDHGTADIESEEAEALRFALKQMKEPSR